jgi:hypothetical protein
MSALDTLPRPSVVERFLADIDALQTVVDTALEDEARLLAEIDRVSHKLEKAA